MWSDRLTDPLIRLISGANVIKATLVLNASINPLIVPPTMHGFNPQLKTF